MLLVHMLLEVACLVAGFYVSCFMFFLKPLRRELSSTGRLGRAIGGVIAWLEHRRRGSPQWDYAYDWLYGLVVKIPPLYWYLLRCRKKKHPLLYKIETQEWEERYLSSTYQAAQEHDQPFEALCIAEPCKDVYTCSVFSDDFCRDLLDELDAAGMWHRNSSNVANKYRSGWAASAADAKAPTVEAPAMDVSIHKIWFDVTWLRIHNRYIRPVIRHCFSGYQTKGLRGVPFALRYFRPSGDKASVGQTPHHDNSVVTTSLALNSPHCYDGGGCVFFRQKYKLAGLPAGTVAFHPGALTHQHAGLPVRDGERCVLISFFE